MAGLEEYPMRARGKAVAHSSHMIRPFAILLAEKLIDRRVDDTRPRSGASFAIPHGMSIRRECPRCRKVGFVRQERVFQAGNGLTEFVCGACEYTWVEHDETRSSEVREQQG